MYGSKSFDENLQKYLTHEKIDNLVGLRLNWFMSGKWVRC